MTSGFAMYSIGTRTAGIGWLETEAVYSTLMIDTPYRASSKAV